MKEITSLKDRFSKIDINSIEEKTKEILNNED